MTFTLRRFARNLGVTSPKLSWTVLWMSISICSSRPEILGTYANRILDFDRETALAWGRIKGETNRIGLVRPDLDAQIAATALVHGLTVVTRNVSDMAHTGVAVVNPFE